MGHEIGVHALLMERFKNREQLLEYAIFWHDIS